MELNQPAITLAALREEILPKIQGLIDDRDQAAVKIRSLTVKKKERQELILQLQAEIVSLKEKITANDSTDQDLRDFSQQLAQREAELACLEQWLRVASSGFQASQEELQKAEKALNSAIQQAFIRMDSNVRTEIKELLEKATAIANGWKEAKNSFLCEMNQKPDFGYTRLNFYRTRF